MPQRKKRRSGSSALSRMDVSQLITELKLRRESIARELETINAELADLATIGGQTVLAQPASVGRPKVIRGGQRHASGRGGRGRGRGGNKQSLPTLLQTLLRGKTMGVSEMADAAMRAGHKT